MLQKKLKLTAPSTYQEALANLFSKEVFYNSSSGNLYKTRTRNNVKEENLISDIYLGKMAEFAVWNFLHKQKKNATFPDINVYESYRKNYDADIMIGETKVHVKSCSENSYGNSWVFRPSDPIVSNPDENDFVALVVLTKQSTFDAYFLSAIELLGMYKPPRNPDYHMMVIYEEDLK
jgi:hypothetical protein